MAAVRSQLSEAFVKILVHDGVDVTTVCHAGRTVTAHVQSALEARDPVCVVPGCDVAHGLQNHHWDVDLRAVQERPPWPGWLECVRGTTDCSPSRATSWQAGPGRGRCAAPPGG